MRAEQLRDLLNSGGEFLLNLELLINMPGGHLKGGWLL